MLGFRCDSSVRRGPALLRRETMTINLSQFLFGFLLLCFPRQWMRIGFALGSRRRRGAASRPTPEPWQQREAGDPRVGLREFTKVRNYFDLLRAAAGGLAVLGGPGIQPSIGIADSLVPVPAWQVIVLKLGVVGLGVLIQIVRYERHHFSFFAPIFYLSGLTVSLCGPWGALFAFILIWAVNPILRGPQAFLSVYAIIAAAFGLLFRDVGFVLPKAAFLYCFLPVLLSLLAQRPLVVFTRKAVQAGAGT